jgi:hypothetical protein
VSDQFVPDDSHPEQEPGWKFDDDSPGDDVDVDDDGYEPDGPDAEGTDVITGNEEFLWAEAS